jgi:KipI family sensor histidine kinase inhibitor
LPLGDCAVTLEFSRSADKDAHARALYFAQNLRALRDEDCFREIVEWTTAFASTTVHFRPDVIAPDFCARLLELAQSAGLARVSGAQWRIPVCFDDEFAPDLQDLAALKGLSRDEVVSMMTRHVFDAQMLGFLPGFAYLGGVPEALEAPRLATPRAAVPAGSLAVAGRMCAVYPWVSPGGWRLIGRTPVRFFDASDSARPALFAPGDLVSFTAIDRAAFDALAATIARGAFSRADLGVF